jgi:hypothetical protein
MSWDAHNIDTVIPWLKRYYPKARAWEAVISEAELGVQLDGWQVNQRNVCEDIQGIAIDIDGDGRADMFLGSGQLDKFAYLSKDMDRYLSKNPVCKLDTIHITASCDRTSADLKPTGFPFKGRLLPVTSGKIKAIMFAESNVTKRTVSNFLRHVPDVKCQILKFRPKEDTVTPLVLSPDTPTCAEYRVYPLWKRTCDLSPCGGGIWVQNESVVGLNEFGETVAAATNYERGMTIYAKPLADMLGAVLYSDTNALLNTANALATTTHLFVKRYYSLWFPESNLMQMFASGLKIVEINMKEIYSTPDLDMILTPTDESVDGRPVVILAKYNYFAPNAQRSGDAPGLNRIASELRANGFYVLRVPYDQSLYDYNNVLLEKYMEDGKLVRKVYLPRYDDERSFKAASSTYEGLGFEVVPIDGPRETISLGGALHCMVKVTQREL